MSRTRFSRSVPLIYCVCFTICALGCGASRGLSYDSENDASAPPNPFQESDGAAFMGMPEPSGAEDDALQPESLGTLSANRYDPDSVANPYGPAGSRYNPDSVRNPYGKYGSRYSPQSVNNPYAHDTPVLIGADGKYLGKLSANRYEPDSVSNPYGRYGSRYSPDSINNPYGVYGSRYSPYSPRNPYATRAPRIVKP